MVAIDRKNLGFDASAGPAPRQLAAQTVLSERAFKRIVEEHAPYVWRVLRSLGVREGELEDVSQETFLIVHRQLPTFEGRAKLRTWIYGISLRVASDHRDKAYRRREVATAELPDQIAQPTQETRLEHRQAVDAVDALLAALPEDRRQVFVLYEVEQLTMREVAEIVGCPLTTAYSRYYAARETITAQLGSHANGKGTV